MSGGAGIALSQTPGDGKLQGDVNQYAKVRTASIDEPESIGGIRVFHENDAGFITGSPSLFSPEVDNDYRMRTAVDTLLDSEIFNYTAQNTGKFNMLATTLAPSFTLGSFNTNPTSLTTAAAGVQLRTYATFPIFGTCTTAADIEGSFTAQPTVNCVNEFGFGLIGAAVANAPIDGVFLRLTSAGLQGIVNYNGLEATTGVFPTSSTDATPWAYILNKKYQFIVYIGQRRVAFWVNDGINTNLLGSIETPAGQGQPCASSALPVFTRQYHSGAAGSALSFAFSGYSVRIGGGDTTNILGVNGNALHGSAQGLSGGTIGSSMFGTVTTGSVVPPTPAVPTNTTATLGSGLGGTFYETVSLAVATDGIVDSFQVPALSTAAGATYAPQRRLRVDGVSIGSFVQTVVVGGGYNSRFYVAFGHTAVSLQTTETATTKAPRRKMLPIVQLVTAAQAANTMVAQNIYDYKFKNPIYVNPGEFLQLVTTHTGTAGTTGTVAHQIDWDYTWE